MESQSRNISDRVHRMLVASKDVAERNRVERALRCTLEENVRLQEELEFEPADFARKPAWR